MTRTRTGRLFDVQKEFNSALVEDRKSQDQSSEQPKSIRSRLLIGGGIAGLIAGVVLIVNKKENHGHNR